MASCLLPRSAKTAVITFNTKGVSVDQKNKKMLRYKCLLIRDIYGLLVKWLNTLPSQGSIHGFEFRTGYQISKLSPLGTFLYIAMLFLKA